MKTYKTLDGTILDLSEIEVFEQKFLQLLKLMVKNNASYFDIARTAIGPGSPALQGRHSLDRETAQTPLYRAAVDIATRSGIDQGLILAPEHEAKRKNFPTDGSHFSVAQAAEYIGISRSAVYKAIQANTLKVLRIGNVTVVNKQSAIEYKKSRNSESASIKQEKQDAKDKAA